MPRSSRIKDDRAIYHIIVRSISEVNAFKKDIDKERYLNQMNHYKDIFNFKVHAYCIMSNHAHFAIEAMGADISKIMHGLNLKYAVSYNKIYERHGHLFQDRFKSKIVDSISYFATLIAYIHNNPIKIKGYEKFPEKYRFSSLKVYLGIEKDTTGLLDEEDIRKKFEINREITRENYLKFVYLCDDAKLEMEMELQNQKSEYKNEKEVLVGNFNVEEILDFIAKETGIDKILMYIKNNKKSRDSRALATLLMRGLCDYKIKDICKIIGNTTQSTVSKMCNFAVHLISSEERYRNIIFKFLSQYKVSLEI